MEIKQGQTIHRTCIANNLNALLKQHRLSASQLALDIGLPIMTIRRLLSGETEDPRISTLTLISNYFNLPVDQLISDNLQPGFSKQQARIQAVPKLSWEDLPHYLSNTSFNLEAWSYWQSISINTAHSLSTRTFALESRPSMYPRFPQGTVFIIDPQENPTDGDIVLIKIKENNTYTLRELIIDPPDWRLSPLVLDSTMLHFSTSEHEIVGVCILTILYHPKIYR